MTQRHPKKYTVKLRRASTVAREKLDTPGTRLHPPLRPRTLHILLLASLRSLTEEVRPYKSALYCDLRVVGAVLGGKRTRTTAHPSAQRVGRAGGCK